MKTTMTLIATLLAICISAPVFAAGKVKQMEDVVGQGAIGPVVAENGATIIRTAGGISVRLRMPTPEPFGYVYPEPNAFQATVEQGHPEVFTGWIFIFNNPDACSDGICDGNDVGDPVSRGGAYNFAGHIAGGPELHLAGNIHVGEDAPFGFSLDNPMGAEVHLAVAPHGTLQPNLLPTQINTPIGTPALWWLALFFAP